LITEGETPVLYYHVLRSRLGVLRAFLFFDGSSFSLHTPFLHLHAKARGSEALQLIFVNSAELSVITYVYLLSDGVTALGLYFTS
jgi:hypothetical protein